MTTVSVCPSATKRLAKLSTSLKRSALAVTLRLKSSNLSWIVYERNITLDSPFHAPKWIGSWKYKVKTHRDEVLELETVNSVIGWSRDGRSRDQQYTNDPEVAIQLKCFPNNFSFRSHLKFRAMQGMIWSSNFLSFYSPLNVRNLSHNPQQQPREAAHWSTQRFHSLHASTHAAFWTLLVCEAASWSASVALKTVLQYHATKQKKIDRQIIDKYREEREPECSLNPSGIIRVGLFCVSNLWGMRRVLWLFFLPTSFGGSDFWDY